MQNIFSIPELLKKMAFTLGLLCIYRIGFHVPLAGLDQSAMQVWGDNENNVFAQALAQASMLTGGSFQRSSLFGLGIMPYISASIIFQLLVTVVPALEKLRKEGAAGQKKIQEYTRYATVGLCIVQAVFWMITMRGSDLLYPRYQDSTLVFLMGVVGLTGGTIFLMWLGEQIDEYGIGNGISLIIMAGIVVRLPTAVGKLYAMSDASLTGTGGQVGLLQIAFVILSFVFVVAGSILITQGQRRIKVQQAKQVRGRRMTAGGSHFIPLRINHGGVMPIIFASSLMIFPNMLFSWMGRSWNNGFTRTMAGAFQMTSYTYTVCYVGMIFFFAFFWTTVQFRPKEMADQLRDNGSFVPGLRPGKRTAEHLEKVMGRITYCGAAFLATIAVIPMVIATLANIPYDVSSFLGGTGLLILVSVALDLVQRIEANLVMRNYDGFLGGSSRIKGAYG
ncbi:MAG: preprotein translocase subunit SecY [Phycisphaerae bacterium]|nr:preprotein translocase subunit SecY [Phycisphaerae bacterium]MDP7286730.1 preprotein translocase subunit SecY [Phycisphaerae bacterium]